MDLAGKGLPQNLIRSVPEDLPPHRVDPPANAVESDNAKQIRGDIEKSIHFRTGRGGVLLQRREERRGDFGETAARAPGAQKDERGASRERGIGPDSLERLPGRSSWKCRIKQHHARMARPGQCHRLLACGSLNDIALFNIENGFESLANPGIGAGHKEQGASLHKNDLQLSESSPPITRPPD